MSGLLWVDEEYWILQGSDCVYESEADAIEEAESPDDIIIHVLLLRDDGGWLKTSSSIVKWEKDFEQGA